MRKKNNQAFSLVEMLSVIAVIGIISAIAVPSIGRINDSAREAAAKRNAQNIASVITSAQAAGLDFLAPQGLPQTVANVVQGGTVSEGVFAGAFFGVPSLSATEIDAVQSYLWQTDTQVLYMEGGSFDPILMEGDPNVGPGGAVSGGISSN